MTVSGSSPDRISLRIRDEASLEKAQYSRRRMSSPLTSIFSMYLPSTSMRLMGRILLLRLEQQSFEDVIDIDLQELVSFIDVALEFVCRS